MGQIFNKILFEPFLNLLIFFYHVLPFQDLGVSIIILTLIIRLILFPLSKIALKSQKALQALQPKLEEIKKKYPKDMQKQSAAMMNLYRENKVNPFSSCLLLLVQLPVLIAFFKVLSVGVSSSGLNPIAFGFLNLAKPNIFLALITAYFQYLQMKVLSVKRPEKVFVEKNGAKDENLASRMNKQMTVMMPFLTLFIGLTLPSGVMLYWLISVLFSIFEQKLFLK